MDALEEEEEEEENDVGNMNDVEEAQGEERKLSKKVRTLLGTKVDIDAALSARTSLLTNQPKLRSHR